jgi:Family of unknown function (DUF5677)
MEETMPDLSKMIKTAHEVKERLDKLLLRANVQDSGEARVSATLCLTISEQFAAALHLIEGGFSTHAPVIVRPMLEGLATLLNLTKDPRYLDQIRFDSARADVTLFEEYTADPEMREDKDALATLAAWKDKAVPIRDALKLQGIKPLGIVEQFKRAGMLQNYVAYRVFCSFSHNQLTTLISRHAGDFELRYHHEAPPETTESVLTVALSVLCRAFETLPKFTDLLASEVTSSLDDADEIWAQARL